MQWLLRFRVGILIFFSVVLISTAVIFSVLRAVLPYATGYKAEIQQELSRQIGLPVEIDSIDAVIHWFSPRLKLLDVAILDKKNKSPLFHFKEAFVELDVTASIFRGELIVDDVGLIGADLSVEKLSKDEWLIQGIKVGGENEGELPEQFTYMLQHSDYLLHDSNIHYRDHTDKKLNFSLLNVNIDVSHSFYGHDIKFSMNLPDGYGRDLAVVANLQGDVDEFEGDIYIDASQINIKQWNNKFNLLKQYSADAIVDLNLWLTLENNNIKSLISTFSASDVSFKNTKTNKTWKTNYLSSDVRYVYDKEHWNAALSHFYFGDRLQPSWGQETSITASDDKDNFYLSANLLRIQDVIKITEVFLSKEQLSDIKQLKSNQIKADLFNLNLRLPKNMSKQSLIDNLSIDSTVVDLSLFDKSSEIKLSGVDAAFQYKNKQTDIQLNAQDANIEIKNLFREPLHAATLSGNLKVNYDGDMWRLTADQLQLKNDHLNTFSRLDIKSTTSENIFVDIQTNFYDAHAKYAKHYLPVGIMSTGLVKWLDMAVVEGFIPNGSFSLHGNLDDFPFTHHDGMFQVLLSPQQVTLQFLEDWPLITNASAALKFNNQSLFIYDAKGKTQDASLYNGYAEIINLAESHLTFTADVHAENADIQSYIWNSPLDDVIGNAMRLFQFSGKSDLNLELEVPLDEDEIDVAVKGRIKFIDTNIDYPTLGYELKDINGVVNFTEDSIFADSMDAFIQGRKMSINAFTRDAGMGDEIVFHLDGVIAADYLLQHYDWMPKGWFSGQSNWAIDIEVPNKPQDYLVHIKANSYLEDVAIHLSDRAQKSIKTKVHLSTEIDVLDNNGLYVTSKAVPAVGENIEEASIFDVFAKRDENDIWTLNIKSEYLSGEGRFAEGLGKESQIKLNLENIDLYSLFYRKNKNDSEPLSPSLIPSLSWNAKTVQWDDWAFTDAKVETDWHEHGMVINTFSLKGKAMTFDAHGTWLTSWRETQKTVMHGTMTSSNMGKTLTSMGFERSIHHGEYSATFDSSWPAEPFAMTWANIKGKASFEMEDGEIIDVDPGAGGRLLGLLNIFKLANRLILDFDDVTRKGFAFDTIKGDFEFSDGDGSLKDFDVSAAAADVNMFGRIGMVERDYSLLMRVKPHTDSLTFAGGAILGGVVVGAGLALIQKVLDLGSITHNIYSITGSWDDPIVEKIVEKTEETESDIDEDEDDF